MEQEIFEIIKNSQILPEMLILFGTTILITTSAWTLLFPIGKGKYLVSSWYYFWRIMLFGMFASFLLVLTVIVAAYIQCSFKSI